jgi:hypothetical protein
MCIHWAISPPCPLPPPAPLHPPQLRIFACHIGLGFVKEACWLQAHLPLCLHHSAYNTWKAPGIEVAQLLVLSSFLLPGGKGSWRKLIPPSQALTLVTIDVHAD